MVDNAVRSGNSGWVPAPPSVRAMRLASGLVIFSFVTTHLLNHAMGLISLDAMGVARGWFVAFWRSTPATILFYGSVLVHAALAMVALYRRRTLRMPPGELVQLVLGLAIPFLVIPHAVGTRLHADLTGLEDTYDVVVQTLWVDAPMAGLRQMLTLLVAWTHGCIGIHFWLRHRSWYPAAAPWLFAVALLIPVLALIGFAQAGKEVAELVARYGPEARGPDPPMLEWVRSGAYGLFGGAIAATLAARGVRAVQRRSTLVRIAYPDRQIVAVPRGFSVLEASRLAGIPHVSVCGGRGRCSTCRVRIVEGADKLPEPSAEERATLDRVRAPQGVRLACQLRPTADLSVIPLIRSTPLGPRPRTDGRWSGEERAIAVLFCDLRGFTALSEQKLPFDVVHLLNQYFAMIGQVVEGEGGRVDKFIGDGAMALFGVDGNPDRACRQAIAAACAVAAGVEEMSQGLQTEVSHPLRLAMGLHAGVAIVGEMGYGPATSLTAVGDVVNVASRLEGLAKELDAELVVSDTVVRRAGLDLGDGAARDIAVRGRAAPVRVLVLPRTAPLQAALRRPA